MKCISSRVKKYLRKNAVLSANSELLFRCEDEFTKKLIKKIYEENINFDVNKVIKEAMKLGYVKTIKLLLKYGIADMKENGALLIMWAAENGYTKLVKELLKDTRVNSTVYNNYAIKQAAANGYLEIVKLLLEHQRIQQYFLIDSYKVAKQNAKQNGHKKVEELLHNLIREKEPMW